MAKWHTCTVTVIPLEWSGHAVSTTSRAQYAIQNYVTQPLPLRAGWSPGSIANGLAFGDIVDMGINYGANNIVFSFTHAVAVSGEASWRYDHVPPPGEPVPEHVV
ncbi:hypothetical protein OIDMADRAFT_25285 [Oidiodendron maius Zn]|uniref:Uncharacterized protein n=1 Tax=Oidiodendron maius (strain Zn) TaxID=913774 RepID=A0A0C3D095_OIDMZ|nr:hypothetical protein OIDMADRAFT_25285 [Oidiodendron maius Zn]